MNVLAIVDDPLFAEHRAPAGHPERPERLDAARAGLAKAHLGLGVVTLGPRDATDEELGRVHGAGYLARLGRAAGGSGYLDADTYYCPASVDAARRAAGGAVGLVDALIDGQARFGLALVRPPGHHARPSGAMGFCLLNNVAVAAAHARARGIDRVAVIDFDVHHGNGTQETFFADPSVLFVSLHQFPFYPGTGAADEVGQREGTGFTVNVPLSAGADDAVYAAAFDRLVAPIVEQYDPGLVLISAGFDAHQRDPLASMSLSDAAYGYMVSRVAQSMPRGANGRMALVLEGGYDLGALSESLTSALGALEDPAPLDGGELRPRHEQELARILALQKAFWQL
ncbi:MAG: histone deacetylase [Polyangiaceae bacterium]|nr:histone deacetylase [Polyangiaceae bacterium]